MRWPWPCRHRQQWSSARPLLVLRAPSKSTSHRSSSDPRSLAPRLRRRGTPPESSFHPDSAGRVGSTRPFVGGGPFGELRACPERSRMGQALCLRRMIRTPCSMMARTPTCPLMSLRGVGPAEVLPSIHDSPVAARPTPPRAGVSRRSRAASSQSVRGHPARCRPTRPSSAQTASLCCPAT